MTIISHLNICAAELPDFLDLAAALAYEGAALAGRHDQLEAHPVPALPGAGAAPLLVLHPVTDESVGLKQSTVVNVITTRIKVRNNLSN